VDLLSNIGRQARRNRGFVTFQVLNVISNNDNVARTLANRAPYVATAPKTVVERVVDLPPISGGGG